MRILVKFTTYWTPSTTLRFGRQHTSKLQFNTFHELIMLHSRYNHVMMNTITIISDTHEMEDMLADFLKVDALISEMEEKLEVM